MGDPGGVLWDLLERYIAAEDLELDDVEVAGSGRGRIVRVVIDHPDGVDVERIADLSRGVSRLLDDHEPFNGTYTLEVSSPGLERKLRRPLHYRKALGKDVKVTTRSPVAGATVHDGVLDEADETGFVLQLNDERRRIAYNDVKEARTLFTWSKAAKPGKRR